MTGVLSLETVLFAGAAAGAVISALLVIWQRNPVVSALFLVANLGCVAVLFLTLGGEFLAAVQVIIYAGAIMVLFLFVIMLLNPEAQRRRFAAGPAVLGLTFALGLLFIAALWRAVAAMSSGAPALPEVPSGFGSAGSLGRLLFTGYLYPVEVTGVLLLVSMVGAVVLARRGT
ncbi:MAG: NADH-quinone oxidoreductase subunit J [Acidobacteriota bacterium]